MRHTAHGHASLWQCLQCFGVARNALGAEATRSGCRLPTRPAAARAYFLAAATFCWGAGRGLSPEAGDLGSALLVGVSYCLGGTRGHVVCEGCSGASDGGVAERPELLVEQEWGVAPTKRSIPDCFLCRARSLLGPHILPPLVPHDWITQM